MSTCLEWFVFFGSAVPRPFAEGWSCTWHFARMGVTFPAGSCNRSFCSARAVISLGRRSASHGACLSLPCTAVRSPPFKFSAKRRRTSLAVLRSVQKRVEVAALETVGNHCSRVSLCSQPWARWPVSRLGSGFSAPSVAD